MKLLKSLFTAAAALSLTVAAQAQSADEIIAKHIEARGGLDKIRAIQSLVMEGSLNIMGNDVQLRFFRQHGKASKVEITVMGSAGYEMHLPTAGWRYLPFQGMTAPQPMDTEEVAASQDQLDVHGALVDYKTKGHQVEFGGKENIEGNDYYKLVLVQKGGTAIHYFIDKEYKLFRIVSKRTVNGEEKENITTYMDYQKTSDGLLFARTWITARGEISISDIKVNAPIDEAVFKPGN
jgi:hypothetical protein